MKKCILFFLVLLFPFHLMAQVDWPYFDDNSNTIFVPKKTPIIPIGENREDLISVERSKRVPVRRSLDVSLYRNNRAYKLPKDSSIPVIGFIKTYYTQPDYDYYIVEYNDKLYYLSKEYCPDNSLINEKNNSIQGYLENPH